MTDTKMCPYCGEDVKLEAIKCKHCQSMLSEEDNALVGAAAPASPAQQTKLKTKKPIWKRWWVWAAVIILFFAVVASGGGNDKEPAARPEAAMELPEVVVAEAPEEATKTTETSPEATDSATLGEKNAAKSALNYLKTMPFSYSGLVKQLEFEGFTHAEAVYGVDRCGADWNEQAAKSALNYLRTMPFSYSGLVKQLEFEGYTNAEAVFGVDRCGADWNEQAALKAKSYLDFSSFSRDGLIAQLEFEGFTRQQAEHGVQAVGY
jgi:hypothetical protein